MDDNKIKIASQFLLDAPPGEFHEVRSRLRLGDRLTVSTGAEWYALFIQNALFDHTPLVQTCAHSLAMTLDCRRA
jgi:hypothetical protein